MRSSLHHLLKTIRNAAAMSVVALLVAPAALAQGTGGPDLGLGYATAMGLTTADVRTTVARIISYFLGFLGIIAVGIMLYAGFLWMTAGGNEEKVSTAKRWMINGTIGLVIIMSAFAITQFIFRAVQEGAGGGTTGCPPGQVCSGGGGFGGGGAGGFHVDGTTPAGAGPGNGGWPKNYSITVSFNATVDAASATPSSFEVRKCNARLDGSNNPVPFNLSACGAPVAGTLTVDNNRVRFKPSATPGPEPTDFEGDFWYKVRVQGGAIRDTISRTLLCPFQTVDISSQGAGSDYCERAVAFNNLRDVAPPTVSLDAPASPPAYCASLLVRKAQILATGHDDFLVAGIDFLLDGGTANLVDVNGDPVSNATNGGLVNPFTSDGVYVDLGPLTPGAHHMSAVAQDGVPQSSTPALRDFTVNPPHCCNQVLDAGDGETDVDCGASSGCGACNGSSCTDNAQCASGFCNPATHQCEERPFIQTVSPMSAGVGTLVTITGTGFGSTPGSVVFLGADTDGNGNVEGDADDQTAVACAPQAWTDTQVTVAVPTGAITGALKLASSAGPSDRTDDSFGPNLGNFTVGGATAPGICYLDPSTGAPGSKFAIHGAGFGATVGSSTAFMGSNGMSVTTCGAGVTECGWSDTVVWADAPPIAENVYPVKLVVGGVQTNTRDFLLRNSSSSNAPHVTGVIPESGPVGSYVTVQGSGFGSLKGTVKLMFGADTAIAADPVCDDNWHDNYIIIKVPPQYQDSSDVNVSGSGVAHKVQVVTAPPSRSSNDDITFKVTNEAPRPGVCSMSPDNGPPGNAVQVRGEGFGAGPGDATANPRYSILFFKTQAKHCLLSPGTACTNVGQICTNPANGVCVINNVPSTGYSSWSGTQIGTVVAGETVKHCSIHTAVLCTDAGLPCPVTADGTCVADKSGWPATGPVFIVANNQLSTNAIPFTVQNCVESGIACPSGESCCANGSCQKSCQPVARNSAYSWRFSTNVLPVLPQVVERAVCSATSIPPVPQSPSPYKGSTDACKNAQIFFEFNRGLDTASFDSNSVKVEECGDQAEPSCTTTIPLKPFSSPGTFSSCDSLNPTSCQTFITRPADTYNGGTHYFKKNTWYRVTLVSRPGDALGLKEIGADGRYLDGDLDRRQGGDYVYSFRIRNSDDPCQVSSVYVDAPAATIQQDQDPMNFNAGLWGGNCNRLQCGPTEPYAISWSKIGPYLTLGTQPPGTAGCVQPATGVQETGPTPTPLTAEVTPTPIGTAPSKQGHSDVTVKFADPRVIDVTPKADCVQACINADIVATFNVPMDPATMTNSTVELKRCRNASCTAPFETDLGGGITATIVAAPEDGTAPDGVTVLHKHVTIRLSGNMLPGTFYLAKIMGGSTGVKSRSGVNLAGLNDGNYYTWKFRTKDDSTACSVARTSVNPSRAIMRYVGDRKGFTVTPFGSPDECSSAGQQLRATAYNWLWDFDAPTPNRVIQGYYSGGTADPIVSNASPSDLVDTMPFPKSGCTAGCLLTGSQNTKPQCGNGVKELPYEECDDGNADDTDACTNQCLLRGNVAPGCGNHAVEPASGESCDMIPDTANPGSYVWPNGCKQPGVHVEGFADNLGCIFTGSSTATGSVCGDGFIGDGEACDDGGQANGDGCSANCLVEGSLRSCLDVPRGEPCINFCGNSRVEPGEDAYCESQHTCNGGSNAGHVCAVAGDCPGGSCTGPALGCDSRTCLRTGTPKCAVPGAGSNCCGNNVDDIAAGEDPGCDTDPLRAEFCTDRCLYKGSSPYYTRPSFCGDGILGKGEKASCEPSDYVEPPPVPKIDPFQAVSAAPQTGFDATTAAGSTSTVKATVTDVPDQAAGRAQVTLACNCKNEPMGAQDSYCQGINPPTTNNLACADNGCCTPRPVVVSVSPAIYNSCRNPEITVVFDTLMNPSTISTNLLVGYNNGSAACPDGTVEVAPLAYGGDVHASFWKRAWNGIVAFFRNYVLRPVFGAPPLAPTPAEQGEHYCSVQGRTVTITEGPPMSQHSKTFFYLVRALPANKYVRVRLNPGVKSTGGVPIDANGYTAYFGTGSTICAIDKVEVTPPSILLTSATDKQTVTAHGLSVSGQPIVPTIDYNWEWSWTLPPMTSEIVLNPRESNVTQCALPVSGTNITNGTCTAAGPATCPCSIFGQTCPVASGQSTCNVSATEIMSIADVRVRGGQATDLPQGVKPTNTTSARAIEALAHLLTPSGTPYAVSSLVPSPGTAYATVLLCKAEHVWPHYQECSGGFLTIPWIPGSHIGCSAPTWYPFYDSATNTEFYYCRDQGETAGDASTATLPCLKEQPAQVLNPGPDILREYLFTFETSALNLASRCIDGPAPANAKWADDAIGLRVSKNPMHLSAADWYKAKGFQGNPQAVTVDGYDAVKDERTVYVDAAAKGVPAGQLFTNVNTVSYSDGAEPETAQIFSQALSHLNFNSNTDLLNMGICRVGPLRTDGVVHCDRNEDCRVDSSGLPVPGRDAYTCDLPTGVCKNGGSFAPYAGISVACDADVDCQVDALGAPIPARAGVFKCDAPKSKLIRDVRRWSDLQKIRAQLIAKRDATGKFPALEAGTFLRAQTNSRWPSWSEALAKPLGVTLPSDPLNKYGACSETNYDPATCWNDKDRLYKCPTDSHVYEYRSVGGTDFQIRNDFEYKNVNGGTDTWSGGTCLEHNTTLADCVNDASGQCAGTCGDSAVNRGSTCLTNGDCTGDVCLGTAGKCNYRDGKIFVGGGSNPFSAPFCSGATIGTGGVCGDGILSVTEACEIGQTRSQSCDADPDPAGNHNRAGSFPQICNNVCQWVNSGKCSAASTNAGATCVVDSDCTGATHKCINWATAGTQNFRCVGGGSDGFACTSAAGCPSGICASACVGGVCGDGIRQNPPETCDDGPLNGTYGHCNATCTGSSQNCGDGKKQPNEACDCKDLNGQYAFNGTLSLAAEPGVSGPACATSGTNAPTCSWDCQSAGPRCGDGVVNGSEKCDGGFQEFKGYCNDDDNPNRTTGCDTTGQCPDLGTCSAGHCTNAPGKSCGTNDDCVKVCGHFCPTPEQKQRRECTPNDKTSTGDDTIACTWGTWLCTSPGTCGNGTKETGEECDDGNVDNTDSCVIDPANGYSCRKARCGDGYTNPSSGEECDDGANNGRPCLPEYGLTCNYCSGACRVNTVTGGFCGDGLVEDASWSPPPPTDKAEQCDGATGLGVDWICVGKAQQYKSFGKYFGQAVCSNTSCQRACPDSDSEPCLNTPGTNSDNNDTCPTPTPNGCHGPLAINFGSFFSAPEPSCVKGFDGKTRCTKLATFFDPGLLLNASFMSGLVSGGGYSAGSYAGIAGLGSKLYDVCDPDDDNDGVPDDRDCNPTDPYVHPAYSYAWTDKDGVSHNIDIPAAPEYCDGVDNDCNNLIDDNWVLAARPPAGSLKFDGRVVDAFFPDQRSVVGARVIAQRQICTGDKSTPCQGNADCGGGGSCNSFGHCSNNNAVNCTTDYDCPGSNGTCGALNDPKDDVSITDSNGHFLLDGSSIGAGSGIRIPTWDSSPGGLKCGIKIQVDRFKPGSDITGLGFMADGDELEERAGRGYFTQALPIPGGSNGTLYYDGGSGANHYERILLIPVPRPGKAILAFIWSGSLPGYLDEYLSVPGTESTALDSNTTIEPNPLNYQNQGAHRLDDEPWGRLVCSASGGSGTSCGSFWTSPELMIFSWGGPTPSDGQAWKFYLDDYSNKGGTIWSNINGKAPYVIGGYNNGFATCNAGSNAGGACGSDSDCPSGACTVSDNSVAGGVISQTPIYAPTSGYGKYWHVVNWTYHAGNPWSIDIVNHFDNAKPNQASPANPP